MEGRSPQVTFRGIRRVALAALLGLAPLPSLAEVGSASGWRETPPVELQPGDLVCRRARGIWSRRFASVSSREPRFSHAGVVWKALPEPVLIHAEANDWNGRGWVRKDSWTAFFAGAKATECAVFRLDAPPADAARFAEATRARLGVPFDYGFDLSDTNRLYCTELLAVALEETFGEGFVGRTTRDGKVFVAVDDLYLRGFTRIFDSKPE